MSFLKWPKRKHDPAPTHSPSAEAKSENAALKIVEPEIAKLCDSTTRRNYGFDQSVDVDFARTTSYFYVESGSIELNPFRVTLRKDDCIAQARLPGRTACTLRAIEPSTLFEITPAVFNAFPANAQVWLLSALNRTMSRVMQEGFSGSIDAVESAARLSSLCSARSARDKVVLSAPAISAFLSDIPKLPVHAMTLAQKLLADDVPVRDVVESIKMDPALAATVLRVVNSSVYGLPKKIETFYHACMILGFDSIYQLLMRDVVDAAVPPSSESQDIYLHSCLVSVFADQVSGVCTGGDGRGGTTIALLQGLLHDIGRSALASLKEKHRDFAHLFDVVNHSVIGAELLRQWNLPERIWKVVELQQHAEFAPPEALPPEFRRDVAVLHLAHLCSELVAGRDSNPETVFLKDYLSLLQLPVRDIQGLYDMLTPTLMRKKAGFPAELRRVIASLEFDPDFDPVMEPQ